MKQKTKNFNIAKYLPVLVILLSLSLIVSSTFAYFTNRLELNDVNPVTFGKVELSAGTALGVSGEVMDAIAGTPIIDNEISFSLSEGSRPVYVRAKISYSGDSEISHYIDELRKSAGYNFATDLENNAEWSGKEGNYVYLENGSGELFKVEDTTTYPLFSKFIVPTDLDQLVVGNELTQYMAKAQFHLAIQAIQADNLEGKPKSEIKEIFDTLFPESEAEKYTATVTPEESEEPEEPSQGGNATLLGAEANPSVSSNFLGVDGLIRSSIKSITFDGASSNQIGSGALVSGALSDTPASDSLNVDVIGEISVDVSAENDGSIMLYAVRDNEATRYDVTICSNDVISLPANSSSLFAYLINCINLDLNNVDVSNVTNMIDMFRQSGGLTSFTIPSGVATIGSGAFQGCANLTSITIPSSVTIISSSVFSGCSNLTSVYYTGTSDQYDAITKMNGNDALASATKYYNYTNHTVTIISEASGVTYTFLSGETTPSTLDAETQLTGKGRLRISYSLPIGYQIDEDEGCLDDSITIGSTLHGTEYLESINGEKTGYIDIEMDANKTIYVRTYNHVLENSPAINQPGDMPEPDPDPDVPPIDWQEMTQAEFEALDPNSIDAPQNVYVTDTDKYYQLVDSLDGDMYYELYASEEAPL